MELWVHETTELFCISFTFFIMELLGYDAYFQGIDDGWYDGGSISIAVVLVIIVTGNFRKQLLLIKYFFIRLQ